MTTRLRVEGMVAPFNFWSFPVGRLWVESGSRSVWAGGTKDSNWSRLVISKGDVSRTLPRAVSSGL